jgi:hypothetical protein
MGSEIPARTLVGYLIVAALLVGVVFWFLGQQLPDRQWPIVGMDWRLLGVSLGIGLMTVPWLALVWLTHRDARTWIRGQMPFRPLLRMWDQLNSCVLAFAVFVVLAIVPTGVLRVAWFAQSPKPADASFPSSDVLLYGAFFAVLLSAISIPLVTSWRSKARRLVEQTYPISSPTDVTEDVTNNRNRLDTVLHLDVGLIRNPLTALSVFTPLITAVLAAFIPELAGK